MKPITDKKREEKEYMKEIKEFKELYEKIRQKMNRIKNELQSANEKIENLKCEKRTNTFLYRGCRLT